MSNQEPEEEITLSSSAFDQIKDDNKPTTVTREMSQAVQIKEQLKLFRIFDRKYINVNEKEAAAVKSYFFDLSMLDPKPVRKRNLKFKPLIFGLVLLAFAWITYSLKKAEHPLFTSLYVYTAIAVFVAAGLILLVYVIKEFRNSLIFYSQHGRAPIVELLYNVPDKIEFRQFVAELIECIETSKLNIFYSNSQLLAAELSEHRKLRDEKALSSKDYEKAKNNIMKLHK